MVERPTQGKGVPGRTTAESNVLPDHELLRRVRAGQTEAFGELVARYQDRIFNTCWRLCGHLEDARDLTQEAFLKVLQNVGNFREESGFYTWLFRIAVNLTLTHRRKEKRRYERSGEDVTGIGGTQAEELTKLKGRMPSDPADEASRTEVQAKVVEALLALEEDHQTVLILRELEGFDYHEIGAILELPPGTVRSRIHRARLQLARLLKGWK